MPRRARDQLSSVVPDRCKESETCKAYNGAGLLGTEVPASVDVDRGTRDISARIGAQHRHDAGDVLGLSGAPERQRIDELLAHLSPVRFGDARRLDEARRDRIDGDAKGP